MIQQIIPKLPMRDKALTRAYYEMLGFVCADAEDYAEYLIMQYGDAELHFFLHTSLDPETNDGQIYLRTLEIESLFERLLVRGVPIHPNGHLTIKPWGMKEFALLDPDHNLLTFGQVL
jgi:hypothetical protein